MDLIDKRDCEKEALIEIPVSLACKIKPISYWGNGGKRKQISKSSAARSPLGHLAKSLSVSFTWSSYSPH